MLAGCRISVFRKGSAPHPTILFATATEATGVSYSRLRVDFDEISTPNVETQRTTPLTSPIAHPLSGLGAKVTRERVEANQGEICEPFWVQREQSGWMSPDELFLQVKV